MKLGLWRWCVLLCAAGGAALSQAAAPPPVGTIDLRGWNFTESVAALDGLWQFAPGRLVAPGEPWPAESVPLAVPGNWNAVLGGGHGQGTYRLRIQCDTAQPLMLALPVEHSALAWYVNGQRVANQGQPGAPGAGHQPALQRQQVLLPAATCPLDLQVQVSNYEWFRGGLLRAVEVGSPALMAERREQAITRSGLALGSTLMVALFSLCFYFAYSIRRKDATPLWFGLFCLNFVLSMGFAAERVFQPYVGGMSFEGQLRMLFVNWSAGLATFPLFLASLYTREAGRWVLRAIIACSVAATLFALAAPLQRVALLALPLQALGLAGAVYSAVVLLRALFAGRFAAGVLLLGLVALAVTAVHDILFYHHVLATSWLPYGMLAFVVAPAVLLALRLSRALAAEELRLHEQRGRTDMLVRATNAGLLDWDTVNDTVVYSDRYKEMLGYGIDTPDRAMPAFQQVVHPEDRERIATRFREQLRLRDVRSGTRPHEGLDYRMVRHDGSTLWVHAEGIAICGGDGRTLRFICSFIDITARVRQEQELSNRMKFIDDLFDSVPISLALRDPDGKYLLVNRTWERTFGLQRESVIGTSLRDVRDPAADQAIALDRAALARGPDVQGAAFEYDYQRRRLLQTRTVMADAQGGHIGVLVATVDITDKHAMEHALTTERERLRLLVRSTQAGFGDWDAARDTVSYTGRFKEMLGYPADYDTSRWPSIFEMMHPEDRERARAEFRAMIKRKEAGGEQVPGDPMSYRLRRRDGSYIWIHAEGISLVDENGRTRRFITSYLDVTRFREQEEALRASRDQIAAQAQQLERQNETLKENVRLREEVERIGRHDLKTPLNSIVAVPRLLREERKLGPEADELLGIVERAGYRILSMVNLSLDLYKMEQGSYIFRPDAVDLAELLHKVMADVRSHAASKEVRLELQAWQAPYAWAEELLCYSLLANLLKNAVEASPEGALVSMVVEAAGDDAVQVRIHNQGAVPLPIRATFFTKYATLGKASGTGLGTYSARLMARVQDGDVAMQSTEATGTTLTVRLKRAPEGKVPVTLRHAMEHRSAQPVRLAALPPLQVLLVDDDEYNLLIVRRFLPTPPFTVETAINGRVALARAERSWPQLVFMDLDMPVMGGMEAVGKLRALEAAREAPRCAMVALSSHDDDATRARALAAGFDRYLTKPVTREALQEVLLELHPGLGELPAADADLAPLLPEFLASRRVLLDELGTAVDALDRPAWRRLGHQLAGSFAMYGFGWAAERSRALELGAQEWTAAQAGETLAHLRRHLEMVARRFGPPAGEPACTMEGSEGKFDEWQEENPAGR